MTTTITTARYEVIYKRVTAEHFDHWYSVKLTDRKSANRFIAELKSIRVEHIELVSEPCILNPVCIYWDIDETGKYTKTDLS